MYVTRFLSHYEKNPESLSVPPEGPNSGYLVIQDEEEAETSSWFRSSKNRYLKSLPFPCNNISTIRTHYSANHGPSTRDVVFIPVINQSLSCNRYYAVAAGGGLEKSKG